MLDRLLSHEPKPGILGWLLTTDHKRIALLYFWSIITAFILGGIFALLIRLELFFPGKTIVDPDLYNRIFTLHGVIMVFMVIVPAIPAILGNYLIPLMIGARDVAFPKLNLLSYYIYLLGAIIILSSVLFGAVDTGWTFYTPYSIKTGGGVLIALFGVFVIGFSSILTGLNFIVTIHRLRAPGLSWGKLPLFIWASYATSLMNVIATPVIGITLLMLILEKLFGVGFFDPTKGGDPIMFQHFFWFYSHPVVYIMILPAMGIISEIIAVHSRKKIFGYWAMAAAIFGIAFIGFIVWAHHMFTSGMSDVARWIFSFLTFFVAVPTGVKMFNWVATLYKGSIRLTTPMLYAISFLFLFSIGGLTGLWLATISTDVYLHDTYFVVAHFHYVMVGGAITALFGGLFHWFPKITGRMYSEFWGRLSAIFVFIGFNLTFFPQFLLGMQGMPRRYWDYLPEFTLLNQISTIGAFSIALGALISLITLFVYWKKGEKVGDNPWKGATLEWQTSSPPPYYNFKEIPHVEHGPYDFEIFRKKEKEQV
ncbi:MAG: cytochrome c oxidase subunit I [candidate division WOR-3 bacterium]|nr:cytochrome c oxidase subunit I [candidate division WOR-3 bacterium]MCX7948382.1 cytochrome c oxidase subunit I [candidate division WOR-3 bacterium]MDW8151166.1 cytochrome c oxidase subunit I [candidate division WOR-3 bacterium]